MIKGLKEYVEKHGMHLTRELAESILGEDQRWSLEEIRKIMDKRVWFNTTSATDGDILYLGNCFIHVNKRRGADLAIEFVDSYKNLWFPFEMFLLYEKDFDLTPYI